MNINRRTFCRSVGALIGAAIAAPLLPRNTKSATSHILTYCGVIFYTNAQMGPTIYFLDSKRMMVWKGNRPWPVS